MSYQILILPLEKYGLHPYVIIKYNIFLLYPIIMCLKRIRQYDARRKC